MFSWWAEQSPYFCPVTSYSLLVLEHRASLDMPASRWVKDSGFAVPHKGVMPCSGCQYPYPVIRCTVLSQTALPQRVELWRTDRDADMLRCLSRRVSSPTGQTWGTPWKHRGFYQPLLSPPPLLLISQVTPSGCHCWLAVQGMKPCVLFHQGHSPVMGFIPSDWRRCTR